MLFDLMKLTKRLMSTKTKAKKISVVKYIKKTEEYKTYKDYISKSLLTARKSSVKNLYCFNKSSAKLMVDCIKKDLKEPYIFIESCPGVGLITRELLTIDKAKIKVFERNPEFRYVISEIQAEYPDRITMYSGIISRLWLFINEQQNNELSDIKPKNWEDTPFAKIIFVSQNKNYLYQIIRSIVFQSGFISWGRPEFYVIVSPLFYVQLSNLQNQKNLHYTFMPILFSLFFEHETLCTVPAEHFLPWVKTSVILNKKLSQFCDSNMYYFIKAIPKKNLYQMIPKEYIKPFWFFVKMFSKSRKTRIIPVLEEWLPGCGPVFIAQGLGIYHQFGDLSPEELLNVFVTLVKCPGFESCSFLSAMESSLVSDQQEDDFFYDSDFYQSPKL